MRASVIVRSKDEADRLNLTLASLSAQIEPAEIVVVNDGSTDHTEALLERLKSQYDLTLVHHSAPLGRSAAANAGAERASGDILLFLDGDTLAAPDLVRSHMEQHREDSAAVVRGETWHLRCTRPFLDPEKGTPKPGEEKRVAAMSEAEVERSRVTVAQIMGDFPSVDRRAQPGIYPGYGPRRLFEIEMEALRQSPACTVLWAAASGSNQSLSRAAFLESGGFHPRLTINEHRELALRLCKQGLHMKASAGRSYHMIHRSGWRDPLVEQDWEDIFYAAHPEPEVKLLSRLWESLSDNGHAPPEGRITSLEALEEAARQWRLHQGEKEMRIAGTAANVMQEARAV